MELIFCLVTLERAFLSCLGVIWTAMELMIGESLDGCLPLTFLKYEESKAIEATKVNPLVAYLLLLISKMI